MKLSAATETNTRLSSQYLKLVIRALVVVVVAPGSLRRGRGPVLLVLVHPHVGRSLPGDLEEGRAVTQHQALQEALAQGLKVRSARAVEALKEELVSM